MNADKPRYKYHINSVFQAKPIQFFKDNFTDDLQRISFAKRTLGKFVRENFADAYIAIEYFRGYPKEIDFTVERELFEINCECGAQYMWIRIGICDKAGNHVFHDALNTKSQTEAVVFIRQTLERYNLMQPYTIKANDDKDFVAEQEEMDLW